MFQSAHVVEAVGQLDEHNTHVGDHGEKHLADVLCLAILAVGELDLVDFGDAFNDVGNLIAEGLFNLFVGGGGVFNGIVQQAGGDGRGVELHLGQNFCDIERMNDV